MSNNTHSEQRAAMPAAAGGEGRGDGRAALWSAELEDAICQATQKRNEAEQRLREARDLAAKAEAEMRHFDSLTRSLENRWKDTAAPKPTPTPMAGKRKPYQPVDPQVKALIASKVIEEGKEWKEAEETFEVSHATVGRIVAEERHARLAAAGLEEPLKKRGRHTSFTPEALVYLCTEVERDFGVPLKALKDGLLKRFDIDVEVAAISKVLKSLDITWKNIYEIPSTWNDPRTIAQRITFIEKIATELIEGREFVYVDEQGYDLQQARKGHSIAGKPAFLVMRPKGPRVSLIAALTRDGIIQTKLVEFLGPKKRGTNADDFRLFVHDLSPKIRGKVLLLGGAKVHRAEELQSLWPELKARDNIDVLFLPPYSSFLSAIEYAFNKTKMFVKSKAPQTEAELKGSIIEAAGKVTPVDSERFLQKARSYWQQARLGLPFWGKILDPMLFEIAPRSDLKPAAASAVTSAAPQPSA